jgi:hypothetical protein
MCSKIQAAKLRTVGGRIRVAKYLERKGQEEHQFISRTEITDSEAHI